MLISSSDNSAKSSYGEDGGMYIGVKVKTIKNSIRYGIVNRKKKGIVNRKKKGIVNKK